MDLTPVQEALIRELFIAGNNVPAALADRTDYHRKSVQRSLSELYDDGLAVRQNEYGVWRLTAAGREYARDMMFRD
jgi:Mn-dependent DtxR family transcriptional regulator